MFELDLAANELSRNGQPIRIQTQPLRIIALLAQRSGQLIAREEIQASIWPADTFVDFESGVKTALKKARIALGDDAANPRFIETVPRLGYRFIAPVSYVEPLAAPQTPAPRPRRFKLIWAATATVLAAAAALLLIRSHPSPPVLNHLRPFATAHGAQENPSFSPDGQMLAFSWTGPQDSHRNIYVQRLDAASPVRLTGDTFEHERPIWSSDGRQVAFLHASGPETLGIFSLPLVGIGERKWAEISKLPRPSFDWSPDGKWFAASDTAVRDGATFIVLISAITGERRHLTFPPAGWRGDNFPVFSPDSKRVAFRRTMPGSSVEDIYIVPVSGGTPERLTWDNRMIAKFAFTPDGGLLFSSKRDSSIGSLWWLSPRGGRLTRITDAATDAVSPAVSRNGTHIAFVKSLFDVNIWRVDTHGEVVATPLIDSEFPDVNPQFSTDGKRISFASERSGTAEIWVSDVNGLNPMRLTDGRGTNLGNAKWSPDDRRIAYEWHPSGRGEIWLMASDGGRPVALVADSYNNSTPAWSHDGRAIYFSSNRSGISEIWKVAAQGGRPEKVGAHPGFAPALTPDGVHLCYIRTTEIRCAPLNASGAVGTETRIVTALMPGDWGNWAAANEGIYYIQRHPGTGAAIQYADFSNSTPRIVYTMNKPPIFGNSGLAISPDGKTLLFAQVDKNGSNIFVQ